MTYNIHAAYKMQDGECVPVEQSVEIDGYDGYWSALEVLECEQGSFYIYENDRWGDMTCYLVVQFVDEQPIAVYETYDNLLQCLIDEEILDSD